MRPSTILLSNKQRASQYDQSNRENRNMESFASDVPTQIFEVLAKIYMYDVDESKEHLGVVTSKHKKH